VIFLFLQTEGWYVVPNSRKGDTMSFEYLVVDPRDGRIAGVQVKTGNTPINVSAYSNFPHKVFLLGLTQLPFSSLLGYPFLQNT